MAFPYGTALLAIPVAGAVVTAAIPARKAPQVRAVAIGASLVTFVLSIALLADFDKATAGYQFVESKVWIKSLGIRYLMGIDGISLFMVVLTGLLFPIALLASNKIEKKVNAYFALMLTLEAALMGIFLSVDLCLFFVFWEAMLVPMYFLIGTWGYDRRIYAALKFFIYTAAGSALLLLGILSLAALHAGATDTGLTFDLRTLIEWDGLNANTARWLFLAFGASFAIKVPLFPQASVDFAPLMLTLATIGILYGAIVAAMQRDLKKLVAYSSVAHLGFVVLGTFALTTVGIQGGIFTMVSHGLTTGALFLLVGVLYDRRHTRQIDDFGGVWKSAPKLGGIFLAITFASIGLPGLSGFVGEFLSLIGTFVVHRPYAILSAAGVILAAVYMLWGFQRVFTGEPTGENATFADLNRVELATLLPLVGLSLFLGLFPKPLLERVEPSVKALIAHVESRSDHKSPKVAELGPEGAAESPSSSSSSEGGHD